MEIGWSSRWKPDSSGHLWANGHHLNHNYHYHGNMVCQGNICNWQDDTGCLRNEELQSNHPWNRWDKVDRFQSVGGRGMGGGEGGGLATRGLLFVLKVWRRQCTTHPGHGSDAVQDSTEGFHWMGGTQTKDSEGHIQNQETEDQHGCHPTNDRNEDVKEEFYSRCKRRVL